MSHGAQYPPFLIYSSREKWKIAAQLTHDPESQGFDVIVAPSIFFFKLSESALLEASNVEHVASFSRLHSSFGLYPTYVFSFLLSSMW